MKEYKLTVSATAHIVLDDTESIEDYLEELEKDDEQFLEVFEFGTINHERQFRRMS